MQSNWFYKRLEKLYTCTDQTLFKQQIHHLARLRDQNLLVLHKITYVFLKKRKTLKFYTYKKCIFIEMLQLNSFRFSSNILTCVI